ncbi:MAG TPA: glycosyltransferase family 9 protein [Vicinamibacterales bacterium]|nr:glycosyltransferase family 9 protein [Vicinamibacterales bacterium]
MFRHLHIPYRNERWLVGLADAGLRTVSVLGWPRARPQSAAPRRILLLRLEKVGDLVMVLEAIGMVKAFAPDALIDLVVGSWNRDLAGLIPGVHIETLDVPWIARKGHGMSWPDLMHRARAWRLEEYDLAINFEPDIRSNLLLALSGASRRVGFVSGGGGALLTDGISPDPRAHIADNAKALVARAFATTGLKPRATGETDKAVARDFNKPVAQGVSPVKLHIPDAARRRAADLIATPRHGAPLVGIQPATGRRVKEWDPVRFAEVGAALARTRGATVVLIGSDADKPVLDAVRAAWPNDVPLAHLQTDVDLVVLSAVLERLSLLITGDTGPMHLAAAVGTPVLAIFGPSLPTRYAPLSPRSRIVRIDIHCSPCNLMRQPPERCVGHVPDCLTGISAAEVLRVANEMLNAP